MVRVNVRRKKQKGGRPLLVIDADIIAYQAVLLCLKETRRGDEWTWTISQRSFKNEVTTRIEELEGDLDADSVILCFGSMSNWRKRVLPSYKANRSQKKPLGYGACVEWMCKEWDSIILPHLEADDLCGLIQTGGLPEISRNRPTVLVSEDKDFRTIPGRLYNPRRPKLGVVEISEGTAMLTHLIQTLAGDVADNFKGCPGVGLKTAHSKILSDLSLLDAWGAIVKAYEKKDLTEDDALVQARVARILQKGDYNPDTGELTLWEPELVDGYAWKQEDWEAARPEK